MECLPSDVIKIIKYYVLESPHKRELLKKVLSKYTYKIIYNKNLSSEVITCYNKQTDIYTIACNTIIITDYELPDFDTTRDLTRYMVYSNYIYEDY